MERDVAFSEKYVNNLDFNDIYGGSKGVTSSEGEIRICVENFEENEYTEWSYKKLQDKLIEMRDACNLYEEGGF